MRGEISNRERIGHIVDMIGFIEKSMLHRSKADYDADFILQAALVRWLQNIGEAASKLTVEFKKHHHEINWKEIIGLRHVVVHDYFEVDPERIWEIVPRVKAVIFKLYNEP